MNKKIKIVIITANEKRHQFFRSKLSRSKYLDLKICFYENDESRQAYKILNSRRYNLLKKHFIKRRKSENFFFSDYLKKNNLSKKLVEINRSQINHDLNLYYQIKNVNPDLIISYGCSLIKGKILKKFKNRMINVHLGLSPYYKGSATNFWPFVNNELQFLGVTFMVTDKGIDTGKILHQFRPKMVVKDDVHSVGNRMILEMTNKIIKIILNYKKIRPIKQKKFKLEKIFKKKDFNIIALNKLKKNMKLKIVKKYLMEKKQIDQKFKIIESKLI